MRGRRVKSTGVVYEVVVRFFEMLSRPVDGVILGDFRFG